MAWFYATSVSVTNGATVVSVNAGDDIALAQGAGGLVIGTQPPVEIKRTYLDGSSNKKIELLKPWPYGSQTNQAAYAFPTDGDLAAATAVLKQLIDSFTLATQAEAQAGTENTKPMTALRVKQAMDALLGSASKLVASASVGDTTLGRAARIGDHGLGLDGNDFTRITPLLDYSGGVDFNTITAPGWHKVLINASNSSNYPPFGSSTGYWYVQVLKYAPGQLQQYAYSYMTNSANPHVVWVRSRYEGVWTTWQQANAPALGSVGFDAAIGRSTGALFEFGTNPNGSYLKLADGTMICWGTPLVIANQLSNNNVGTYGWSYYYENNSVQFPAVFAAAPLVQVTPQGAFLSALVLSSSTSAFVVSPITTLSITAGAPVMYVAIGRWR